MSFPKENKGCVLNCEEFVSTENGFVEVDFYDFPSDPKIREIWIERVRKKKKTKYWYPNSKSKLCGMHFNNCGKNILNELLPRYFGDYTYPLIGNGISDAADVKVKQEIEFHDEPLLDCIADYSNEYNTVPVKTELPNVQTSDISTTEVLEIKQEIEDFETEEHSITVNDLYDTHEKIEVSHNDFNPTKEWKCKESTFESVDENKSLFSTSNTTHSNNCDRDLKKLKEQMEQLQKNLTNAYQQIAEENRLIAGLLSRERESNTIKMQLEEENRKLRSMLRESSQDFLVKKEHTYTSQFQLTQEKALLEMKLARAREKIKLLEERWHRKFEAFGSDEEVKFYTGFQSRADFKKFCSMAIDMDPSLESQCYDIFNIRRQIMITLIRLRQGLHLQDLSFRYDLSIDEVRNIVSHWQDILSKSLFNRKICQSGVIIVKFFTVVLYSDIKLKYFLGVSPFGYVIYVSDLHPLSTSDGDLIRNSEVLSLIEEGFTLKSLDTDKLSDFGINHWSVTALEADKFSNYISKVMKEVKKNGIFRSILPYSSFLMYSYDVSKIWKICWYLQNYVNEF